MKKFLYLSFAAAVLITFTGCDWFSRLFGLDTELSVYEITVYEHFGAVNSVDVGFENDGGKGAEDVEFILVFSEDVSIDTSDEVIYTGSIGWIEEEDNEYTTLYWDSDIGPYIEGNGIVLPVVEGYIGAIIDPNYNFDEQNEDDNANYGYEMTYVPSNDSQYDDDISSATNVDLGSSYARDSYIFPAYEEDWFSFTIPETVSDYRITVEPLGNAANMGIVVELYDTSGSYYFTRDDAADGGTEVLTTLDAEWTVLNTGDYSIKVTEPYGNLGPFRVTFDYY